MKIIEKIVDVTTGEETIVERDETAQEKLQRELVEAQIAERLEAEANAAQKKSALLEKLGITEDEAKLLLS